MSELTPVIPIALAAWMAAELGKVALDRNYRFGEPGGMPSGHSAVVAAAATAIGFEAGVNSVAFGLAVVLVAIVAHDAYRVRWAIGEQGNRLNELSAVAHPKLAPLIVWRGHRVREVMAGLVLGALVAIVLELTLFA